MQTVTDYFNDLWSKAGSGGWAAEHKVEINGVEHSGINLISLKTTGNLYEGIGIGNAMSRQIDIQIRPQGTIPKQAEMKVYTRLTKTSFVKTRHWRVKSSGTVNSSLAAGTYYVKVLDNLSRYADHKIVLPKDCPPESEIVVSSYNNDTPTAYVKYYDEATSTLGDMVNIEVEQVAGMQISEEWQNRFPNGIFPNGNLTKFDAVRFSEWLPKGVYYISTRQTNRITGVMTIHGFDAMLKSGQAWQGETVTESFPMDVNTALADICERMGVELDSRSQIDTIFPVKDFVDSVGYMTMRSVLGRIAVANAGNWVMTDEGKLRLVPMVPGTDSVDLGENAENVYPGMETLPFSRVELLNENGEIVGQAGEAEDAVTGRVLTAVDPEGTDAMAASILGKIQGYVYYPFEAENAILTPAAELGDVVTVGGVTSVIAQETIYFDSLYTADIAAPTTDEVEDEYPYLDERTRVKRAIAGTRSEINKTNDRIEFAVENFDEKISHTLKLDETGVYITDQNGVRVSIQNGQIAAQAITGDKIQGNTITGDKLIASTVKAAYLYGALIALTTTVIENGKLIEKEVGTMSLSSTTTGDGVTLASKLAGLRIEAGNGNVWIKSSYGPFLQLGVGEGDTAVCQLGGGPLVLSTDCYGTGTPPTGTGRVYFKKRS